MKRLYQAIIEDHWAHYDQAILLSGPRQVGKTTIANQCGQSLAYYRYLNWDNLDDRKIILSGHSAIIEGLPVEAVLKEKPVITFDELHKYSRWRTFLKGFIDRYKSSLHVVVTGSAKLDIFRRRGNDSLMGRYFLYRVHPLSVAELLRTSLITQLVSPPQPIDKEKFDVLFEFGGFPELFLKQDKRFFTRWQNLRQQQTLKEEVRTLGSVQEISQLEVLAALITHQTGQLLNYSNLANKVRVSDQTIRRWVGVLEALYYCFTLKPWSKNVTRSLIKEPKVYLWDWSVVPEHGAKVENFVASHLLKAVHFWTDMGFGKYDLYFLRDKEKREVDFLITQEGKPWILLEVKSSGKESLNPHLLRFQEQIKAKHVLQLAFDLPYVAQDCFALTAPKIVSLKTFLSQLV